MHLVGPGGEEWWIEGDYPVADQAKLQARYPALDVNHFIGGSWNGIPGLTAQDVLDAVVVSIGTMGVDLLDGDRGGTRSTGCTRSCTPRAGSGCSRRQRRSEGDLRAGTAVGRTKQCSTR